MGKGIFRTHFPRYLVQNLLGFEIEIYWIQAIGQKNRIWDTATPLPPNETLILPEWLLEEDQLRCRHSFHDSNVSSYCHPL